MKKLIFCLALLIVLPVNANYLSGNELKARCVSDNYVNSGMCMGYITGVVDSYNNFVFCIPTGVTIGQMKDILKKYMDENPAKLHESAVDIVASAMKKDFSCKR
jgi:hypothetical protein